MIRSLAISFPLLAASALLAAAQEYQVVKLDAPLPADALAAEIAALFPAAGFQITKGSQVVAEIWLAKEWPIAADAATSAEVFYPLTPGQVIGAARFPRKASDFRDQEIAAGVYVLRYGQQPVDGSHVGTSPTRDFLLLLPAAKDRSSAVLDYKMLTGISKEAAGTEHPAIFSLQPPTEGGDAPAIREDAEREWVIVRLAGKTKQGEAVKELPVELVIVGKAAE
jgi:hypothetical protein